MIRNAAKREVPEKIFGRKYIPYAGAYATPPTGKKHGRKFSSSLVTPTKKRFFDDLEKVISETKLRDGMTIGFIHNLRW